MTLHKIQVQVDQMFNTNSVTLNLIEKKVGKSLEYIDTGDNFLNKLPVAQTLRSTINKWDIMKLKSLYKIKDTVNSTKWKPTE